METVDSNAEGTAREWRQHQQQQQRQLQLQLQPKQLPPRPLASRAGLLCSSLWKNYRQVVRRHHFSLDLADDTLSRLLFWMPHSQSHSVSQSVSESHSHSGAENEERDQAWREAGYGILSLHRLAMHLALQHDNNCNHNHNHNHNYNDDDGHNAYGTSIRTRNPPTIAATSVRIALTAIHSALPALMSLSVLRARSTLHSSLLSLSSSLSSSASQREGPRIQPIHETEPERILLSSTTTTRTTTRTTTTSKDGGDGGQIRDGTLAAASRARLLVEQIKFLLRMYLLVAYWRQQHKAGDPVDEDHDNTTNNNKNSSKNSPADCGILLDGGLYHVEESTDRLGLPWDRARALQRRRTYVGERTGWTVDGTARTQQYGAGAAAGAAAGGGGATPPVSRWTAAASALATLRNPVHRNATIVAAEVLYVVRPLLWAWFESRYHRSRRLGRRSDHGHNQRRRRRSTLWRGWILCLLLDILSLRLLERTEGECKSKSECECKSKSSSSPRSRRVVAHHPNRSCSCSRSSSRSIPTNPYTRNEIQRRKLRLLLYVLRSPAWSEATLPALERVSNKFWSRIPILGGLAETVLWDWVLYYQHPFVAEEG